jgi:hypothetical protein
MMLFRCSSIGKLMTDAQSVDPKYMTDALAEIARKKKRTDEEQAQIDAAKEKSLSAGAKTYIRELAAQSIFGVDFEVSSKAMEKGILVEDESIELVNRVHGLSLVKNTVRRSNEYITGECDLFDPVTRIGRDIKSSWSLATFPLLPSDCYDKLYEWQMRAYMMLWDAEQWAVDYCIVETPDHLCRYEPMQLHKVNHLPARHRVTTWIVERDRSKEALIIEKVKAAREYFSEVVNQFEQTHKEKS